MRGLLAIVAVAVVALLLVAATILVASGKSFVYSPGVGSAHFARVALPWLLAAFASGIGIGALLHIAGHVFPKYYYHVMWWRDLALLIGLVAALCAAVIYLGGIMMHGAF